MNQETDPRPNLPPVIDHDPPPQIPPSATEGRASEPRRSASGGLALLALVGVIFLAGAVAWLREHPEPLNLGPLDERLAAIEQRLGALEARPAPVQAKAPDLAPLDRRIAALEQRAPADLAPLAARIEALEAKAPPSLAPLDARIAALEAKAPPDLAPLDAKVTALEAKAPPDLAPLDARIATLERHQPDLKPIQDQIAALRRDQPDLKPLDERIAALEQKPTSDTTARAAAAAVAARLDAIATREDSLATRQESHETGIGGRLDSADAKIADLQRTQAQTSAQLAGQVADASDKLAAQLSARSDKVAAEIAAQDQKVSAEIAAQDQKVSAEIAALSDKLAPQLAALSGKQQADDKRLSAAEQGLGTLPGLAERATRLTRIQAAQQALDNGEPVGAVPDAPPALARYATDKPPTEAQLRLSFPAAADAATRASQPQVAGKPLLDRAWAKAQTLVTVRQGDHVLVGDPSAGVIARARTALDQGDLPGAVDAVGGLAGPAANAFAPWLAQARGLLAARAALASLAAQG